MKKVYEKPAMQVEAFVANHYCADCSDSSHHYTDYYFECTAGQRGHNYYITNANDQYVSIDGHRYGPSWQAYTYHPCNENHTVRVYAGESILDQEDILYGYFLDDINTPQRDHIPVVIWTENHTNLHCTVRLDPTQWDIAKS